MLIHAPDPFDAHKPGNMQIHYFYSIAAYLTFPFNMQKGETNECFLRHKVTQCFLIAPSFDFCTLVGFAQHTIFNDWNNAFSGFAKQIE